MLTATMPNSKLQLIKRFFPNITTYTINPEEERKIENVVLIGTSRNLNENVISRILTHEERQHFGKVLVFKPTKRKAKDLFDRIKRIAHIRTHLARDKSEYVDAIGVTSSSAESDVMITHSTGTLGRGINLPEYQTMLIDSRIYRPSSAYGVSDPNKLREVQEEDRASAVVQNAGRVLRKVKIGEDSGFRLIVIAGLYGYSEVESIKNVIQPMVKGDVKVAWWSSDEKEGGTVDDFVGTLATVCQHRGENDVVITPKKDEKNGVKHEQWEERITELAAQGLTWAKVKNQMSYSRSPEEKKLWMDQEGERVYTDYIQASPQKRLVNQ